VPPLILVVEDQPLVRNVTCRFLVEGGFSCLAAATAAEALEILDAGQLPSLLVIDVRLPDLPGPELALRIHIQYPRLPVLFVSGWVDGLTNAAHLEPLRWEFLQKPFTSEKILEAVRRLVHPN
jgi:two-component system cell cycle sensor histidine kinase/response regulator CckA